MNVIAMPLQWKLTLKTDSGNKCVSWELEGTPRHSQQPTGATSSPAFTDENVAAEPPDVRFHRPVAVGVLG